MARVDLAVRPGALCERRLGASELEVLGVGVGDAVDRLPGPWLDRLDPATGELSRVVERAGGPPLEVTCLVVDGSVARVTLHGASFAESRLADGAALQRTLGPTDHRQQRDGQRLTYWPDLRIELALAIDSRRCRLSFGTIETPGYTFDSVALLRHALDWDVISPGRQWPLRASQRYHGVLARRLEVLFEVFGLLGPRPGPLDRLTQALLGPASNPLDAFFRGHAFAAFPQIRLEEFVAQVCRLRPGRPLPEGELRLSPHLVVSIWSQLLRFRQQLELVRLHPQGYLTAGSLLGFVSIGWMQDVVGRLTPDIDLVDDVLGWIIDPARRAFPRGQLVRERGFPDDDLEQIGIEDF